MGVTSRFSAEDYAGAARALMPRGPAWSDDPASVQGRTVGALAQALTRNDAAAVQLLVDAFPATAGAPIEDWEATLGLPGSGTTGQRRSQVVARLVGAGGQSRERYIALAATLGFQIAITVFAPLRAGHFVAGAAALDTAWINIWQVTILANPGGLPPATLKAELDAVRPAETTIILS